MTDIDRVIEEAKASILPYESWECLKGENAKAYAAFCVFRDLKAERNIKNAVDLFEKNERKRKRSYSTWRGYAADFRWKERAADYDRYLERLKQEELRKTIEAQGELHREVTAKMLDVVKRKLETVNPDDLSHGTVTEWVSTAIKADRERAGLVAPNSKTEVSQGEFNFVPEFKGL
jgi:hypothetical protein